MLNIENIDIYGFEAAIRGMRNPKNSWDKSDSYVDLPYNDYVLGENDLKLAHTLAKAGNDHGKFLRMINVTCDITAPLYWWKEFDTYKVGTVANSCSTMHKIHDKEFTLDDFSCEHLIFDRPVPAKPFSAKESLEIQISILNIYREMFIEYGDKEYWWQMIQLLPSSYNQKRTVQLNYAVLKNMYFARKDHKLDEWHTFCDWILGLPHFKEICVDD